MRVSKNIDAAIAIVSLVSQSDVDCSVVCSWIAGEVVMLIRAADSECENQIGIGISKRLIAKEGNQIMQ